MSEFKAITTQEEFDTAIGERLKRERETVKKDYAGFLSPEDVAKKYDGYMSPKDIEEKYKGYISPEEAAKKDASIKAYETNSVKMRIAHENGIPYELANKLSGDTEEDIKKDAETFAKFIGKKQTAPLGHTEHNHADGKNAAYKSLLASLKN